MPYYCISQLRCRLCQFRLEDGDLVIASTLSQLWKSTVTYMSSGIDQERVSPYFPFRRNRSFYNDNISRIKFHMCGGACGFRGRYVPWFHGRCFDFRLLPIYPSFLAATDYTFQPSISEQKRRYDRTQCQVNRAGQ